MVVQVKRHCHRIPLLRRISMQPVALLLQFLKVVWICCYLEEGERRDDRELQEKDSGSVFKWIWWITEKGKMVPNRLGQHYTVITSHLYSRPLSKELNMKHFVSHPPFCPQSSPLVRLGEGEKAFPCDFFFTSSDSTWLQCIPWFLCTFLCSTSTLIFFLEADFVLPFSLCIMFLSVSSAHPSAAYWELWYPPHAWTLT